MSYEKLVGIMTGIADNFANSLITLKLFMLCLIEVRKLIIGTSIIIFYIILKNLAN